MSEITCSFAKKLSQIKERCHMYTLKKVVALLFSFVFAALSLIHTPLPVLAASANIQAHNGVTIHGLVEFNRDSYTDGEPYEVEISMSEGVAAVWMLFSGNPNKVFLTRHNDYYWTFKNSAGMAAGSAQNAYYREVRVYAQGFSGRVYEFNNPTKIKVTPANPPAADNAFPKGNPYGFVDAITVSGSQLILRGWVADGDRPSAAVTLHAYIGGPAGSVNTEGHDLGVTTK